MGSYWTQICEVSEGKDKSLFNRGLHANVMGPPKVFPRHLVFDPPLQPAKPDFLVMKQEQCLSCNMWMVINSP